MTLFESDSQYREKLTIWRIMSLLPLYGSLAEGRIWKWFAINIPMDLGTAVGGNFTSDLDIVARLSDFPNSKNWIYKAWEVKVSLLLKDGTSRSLKAGKTKRNLTQLKAYKSFGSAKSTLLDVYICEDGFLQNNSFPPKEVLNLNLHKATEFSKEGFGYQIAPFQHKNQNDIDVGLLIPSNTQGKPVVDLILPRDFGYRQPFSNLMKDIDNFFEQLGEFPRKSFHQIVFCKNCHQLQLIDMKEVYACPNCNDDFILQT